MLRNLTYQDFAVAIESDGKGGHRARVDPGSGDSGEAVFTSPVPPERVPELLAAVDAYIRLGGVAPGQEPADPGSDFHALVHRPETLGGALHEALFAGSVRDAYQQRWGAASRQGHGLRLRLLLDPDEPVLGALPWELLYDPARRRFLAHDPERPVVRYLLRPDSEDPGLDPASRPLRVLLAAAAPAGTAPLDLTRELEQIEAALEANGDIRTRILPEASLDGLRRALADAEPHVLHILGHGRFDAERGQGAVLLSAAEGGIDRVTGADLDVLLRGRRELRLLVLNTCQGAVSPRSRGVDPFSGLASSLILRSALPAVVAMQLPISDAAAVAFADAFYGALAHGSPVEAAVAESRKAIYSVDRRRGTYEWATPVLFLRTRSGDIFPRPEPAEESAASPPPASATFGDLVASVTRDFVGREHVFQAIDTFVASNPCGYFLIEGDPGVGKTALLAELVRRHGHPHHFNFLREDAFNNAAAFHAHLAPQLIERFGLPPSTLRAERGPNFLKELLQRVAVEVRAGKPLVILVDALDEVVRQPGEANLLHLPETLPPGMFFVLTRRRQRDLQFLFRSPVHRFPLEHDSAANRADVRALLRRSLERPGIRAYLERHKRPGSVLVDELSRRSEGNFMYLYHVLREIADGAYREASLEEIPAGLRGYYEDHWRRMLAPRDEAWRDVQLRVLAALTLARRPQSLMVLSHLSGVDDDARALQVLLAWDSFLHRLPRPGGPRQTLYRLYHESFHEFIRGQDEVGLIDLEGGRRRITQRLRQHFRKRQ
ncbi:MAG: CHAT domain-containing protein [Acidobacteriota bacterium]